ncbi:MAG: hypothetical protein ACI39W_11415 [Brotaphodocola sp.]
MKKQWLLTALTTGLLVTSVVMPTFAADWNQDETGWRYQQDDGSYLKEGWNWVDGRCYYFDEEGYCLLDTVTPDGYTVDASGAWTVNGVVQTQEAEEETSNPVQMTIGSLNFIVPHGFSKSETLSSESISYFVNGSLEAILGVVSEEIPNVSGYEKLVDALEEDVLDVAMKTFGTIDEKTKDTFTTGTWYRYRYANTDVLGIPGQFYAYGRIQNARLEMVIFAGNIAGIDMNGIMNQNLRLFSIDDKNKI